MTQVSLNSILLESGSASNVGLVIKYQTVFAADRATEQGVTVMVE